MCDASSLRRCSCLGPGPGSRSGPGPGLGLGSGRVRVRPRNRVRVGVMVLLEGCEVRVELAAQRLVDRVGAEADVRRRRLEAGQG